VDGCDLQSSSTKHINTEAGTLDDSRSIVFGNNDESLRVDDISINFV
jgi:hypothetical protein